eukprot:CAMPEP_0196809456 /NCGR_PEP_ID=MMETSP1362-20130617/9389_1 /TAXON_ID=163516 /ORGANISM="Leptocylindrus danicus, Strain CCMP1856" /LENGTH=791 /DNA_ID=CAMNT_0042184155 /DNA_START=74 /DNA_END=2449 /DNA_ORIENTATION=+
MGNGDDDVDEYANARKMVQRASNREALLASNVHTLMSDDEHNEGDESRQMVADFSDLPLRRDHINRPCWVCPDGSIYLEAFHELYSSAYDFLVAISEPVARPEYIHQYRLTPYSLYAAVATNIHTESIIKVLSRLSKNEVPSKVIDFIQECTKRYGKAKLCLKFNKYFVESEHSNVLRDLLRDKLISQARVADTDNETGTTKDSEGFVVSASAMEMDTNLDILRRDYEPAEESDDDSEGGATGDGSQALNKQALTTVAFQVKAEQVENVKKRAIELDYPLMEEYDFRNDKTNPDIPMDLKPNTRIRRYQERSLAKMFGNGRARSGIIVLPCGAGKTLTGVTAAQTIKKSCVCLCTNAVSVLQWKYQFKLWTNIPDDRISCFTSDKKDPIHPDGCVLITTYTMVSYGGKRSDASEAVMNVIRGREWGFLLMDEVHVVPAKMFRRVIGSVKAHCRLGLTATLVREDDLISDLNFLIGPKLYEANWMDLTSQGYLANVQCVEVWNPMTGPFMREYLNAKEARLKQLLYVMNPSKIRVCEYLVNFHEARGDKIIVFSDLVYSLKLYAAMLKKPLIYGETSEKERQVILGSFRTNSLVQTICISKVGDTSIDLPEANVIIQVSSHFGSRRQEAQRLGRILRPKKSTATDGTNRSSFNAFFYTLVSTDTQEMFYSSKRQQYLIDQGYTFKIVTNLSETADIDARERGFQYSTPEMDRELLRRLLNSDTEIEKSQKSEDAAIRKRNPDGALLADESVKRIAGGTLGSLSGGGGMRYREKSTSGAKRHALFKKRSKARR